MLTVNEIRQQPVQADAVALWWLAQIGFGEKSARKQIIAIDPYWTNSYKSLGEAVFRQHGPFGPFSYSPASTRI